MEFMEQIVARDHLFGSHKNIKYLKSWFLKDYLGSDCSFVITGSIYHSESGKMIIQQRDRKEPSMRAEADIKYKENTDGVRKDY